MKITSFRSHGKLLITGEYLILKGATGFAIPLKLGNTITIKDCNSEYLSWHTYSRGKIWNTYLFHPLKNFKILEASDNESAEFLKNIMVNLIKLKPDFRYETLSKHVECNLEFDMNWGFGSSATTISNLAFWANINPFDLNNLISKGSGYDIACSRSATPILYSKSDSAPNIVKLNFSPPYLSNIYFIYLGKKQSTDKSINDYLKIAESHTENIEIISQISREFVNCNDIIEAMSLIDKHEMIISDLLGTIPIKEASFRDFHGSIKSLGAWGGDFIMALSKEPHDYIFEYFYKKGLTTIFRFDQLAL